MSDVVVIDNYDSFTYNLVQAIAGLGRTVEVHRNDAITVDGVLARAAGALILSPGPGRPAAAGISLELLARAAGRVPLLGVCLGHQAIGECFGARLVRSGPVHGKPAAILHAGTGLFRSLPAPLAVGRYHSLALAASTLPAELAVTATTLDGVVMAVRHRRLPIFGVQFHPESILTPLGDRLLANFLELARS